MPIPSTPSPADPTNETLSAGAAPAEEAWLRTADGQRLPLRGNCRLGRGSDNQIIIEGQKASRQHAVIHLQDDAEFWLIDLGSLNGTHLNDRRLIRPTRLRGGDRIAVAGVHFVFGQTLHDTAQTSRRGTNTTTTGSVTILDFKELETWLLMADIENFTGLSQDWPPDKLAMSVGQWFRACHRSVETRGGRISKYLGDGFLACWESSGKSAANVAAMLRELQDMRASGEIKFRVAVHRGLITFGGSSEFGEEGMISPDLNFIFRLEDLASRLGLSFCASAPAQAGLAEFFPTAQAAGEFELKGFPGLHRCFSLGED